MCISSQKLCNLHVFFSFFPNFQKSSTTFVAFLINGKVLIINLTFWSIFLSQGWVIVLRSYWTFVGVAVVVFSYVRSFFGNYQNMLCNMLRTMKIFFYVFFVLFLINAVSETKGVTTCDNVDVAPLPYQFLAFFHFLKCSILIRDDVHVTWFFDKLLD